MNMQAIEYVEEYITRNELLLFVSNTSNIDYEIVELFFTEDMEDFFRLLVETNRLYQLNLFIDMFKSHIWFQMRPPTLMRC